MSYAWVVSRVIVWSLRPTTSTVVDRDGGVPAVIALPVKYLAKIDGRTRTDAVSRLTLDQLLAC